MLLLFIIAVGIIVAIISLFYKPTYSVTLNGEMIGYTSEKNAIQTRVNDYIDNGNDENVAFVELENMPKYSLCLLRKDVETNDDEIVAKLTEDGTKYYKYYALTQNEEEKAFARTFEEAQTVIDSLKEKDSNNAETVGIVEKYATELGNCETVETTVAKLYEKKEPVKSTASSKNKKSNTGTTQVANSKVLSNTPTGPASSTSLGISMITPTSGKISSRFGIRSMGNHKGLDISAPKGTAIKASASGTVIFSGYGTPGSGYNSYGNVVAIQSSSNVVMIYAHCTSLFVSKGQQVSQGQLIGTVGSTGRSTGNHLHFEIKVNGKSVNPQNYIYK